jgi:hypothetical protein
MRISLGFGTGDGPAKFHPEDGDASIAETWSPILIDERTGSLMRGYQIEMGGK